MTSIVISSRAASLRPDTTLCTHSLQHFSSPTHPYKGLKATARARQVKRMG